MIQSQAANCKLPIRSEIYNSTFKNRNKVSIIIIIIMYMYVPGLNFKMYCFGY